MILFITGIDTGIGKTVVTGSMAQCYAANGIKVITQKLVQTGCTGMSEDILAHRNIMQSGLLPEDHSGLSCPYVFKFAGSPQLAAALEGRRIDTAALAEATGGLTQRYEIVLIEGAGGLCVPLNEQTTILDFLARHQWPVVLVTAPRLGSINHTLLSLAALHEHRIPTAAVIYNLYHSAPPEIVNDTRCVIKKTLRAMNSKAAVIDFPAEDTGEALLSLYRSMTMR